MENDHPRNATKHFDRVISDVEALAQRQLTEWLLARATGRDDTLISQCSSDLRCLFVNKPYADFLGKPAELIVGRRLPDVVGEAAFEVMRPYVDRVLAGERVEYEAEIPYASAGLRYVRVVYVPGFDLQGAVCGWVATINDLTDRRDLPAPSAPSEDWHIRHAWLTSLLSQLERLRGEERGFHGGPDPAS